MEEDNIEFFICIISSFEEQIGKLKIEANKVK
jgi:hypothetical protein